MKKVNLVLAISTMLLVSLANRAVAIPIGNNVELIPFPLNLGVGTENPRGKLDVNGSALVKGQISINGGAPQAGFVLTSTNTDGLAEWRAPAAVSVAPGSILNSVTINSSAINSSTINNATLTGTTSSNGPIHAPSFVGGTFIGTLIGDGSGITNIQASNIVGLTPASTDAVNLTGGGTIKNTNFITGTSLLDGGDITLLATSTDPGDIIFRESGEEEARIYTDGSAANALFFSVNSAVPAEMAIVSSGNVGVGTSSPAEKLEVSGNVKALSFIGDGSKLTGITATTLAPNTTLNNVTINNSTISGGTSTNQTLNNSTISGGTSTNQTLNNPTINNPTITGSTTVQGPITAQAFVGGTFTGDGSGLANLKPNALFTVGSANPEAQILADGSLALLAGNDVFFQAKGSDAGDIVFVNQSGSEKARIYSDTNDKPGLAFSVGAASPEIYIDAAGNMGINTLVPTEKLQVDGNVKATKFIGDGSGLTGITATTLAPNTTLNNVAINNSTVTGGTSTNQTLNNPTINNPIISGGTGSNQTLSDSTLHNSTLTGVTKVETSISSPSFVGGTFTGTFVGDGSSITNIRASNIVGLTPASTDAVNLTGGGTITNTEFATGTAIRAGGDLVFKGAGSDAGDIIFASQSGSEKARIYSDTNDKPGLAFSVGAASPEIYIDGSGNMGINTVLPTEKLQVEGNVKATKFIGDGSGLTGIAATTIAPGSTVTGITVNNSAISGGTSTNQTLNNPTISGGTSTNQTLNNPTLTGTMTLSPGARINGAPSTRVVTESRTSMTGGFRIAVATCAANEYMLGGGGICASTVALDNRLKESYPSSTSSWTIKCTEIGPNNPVTAYALCATKAINP